MTTKTGTKVADLLIGTSRGDTLTGAEGSDTLIGGNGSDFLMGEISPTNLTLTGWDGGSITLIDYRIDDVLSGGNGNDTLDGGGGNDTMSGGIGNDTYIVISNYDKLIELPNEGIDTVLSYFTFKLPSNVENMTLLGSRYEDVYGNELNNVLIGNNGRNIIKGGAGNDTIDAGSDNDKIYGGSGADHLYGGEWDDIFFLNSVSDFAPGEVIDGGNGINELWFTGNKDESLVLSAKVTHIESIRILSSDGGAGTANINIDASKLTNFFDIDGNFGNNKLIGNNQQNGIYGGYGADTLVGGLGDDVLAGGEGQDVFIISSALEHGINEYIDGGEGFNVIRFTSKILNDTLKLSSHISKISQIEIGDSTGKLSLNIDASAVVNKLKISGNNGANILSGNDAGNTLIGKGGNDSLVGGIGRDILDGGVGSNTLNGAEGDDTYIINNANDLVIDSAGNDTIKTTVNNTTLISGIENLILIGNALNGTGNSGNNHLDGTVGKNKLDGQSGDDSIDGGAGADSLIGGDGNDHLIGGQGNDKLWGGNGADHFIFKDALNKSGIDQIMDFHKGEDLIILSPEIFGVLSQGITDANIHAGAGVISATTPDEHLIYNSTTGNLYYDEDGLGGKSAKLLARVDLNSLETSHPVTLTATDFGIWDFDVITIIL